MTPGGRAAGRFYGPRLFGLVVERSNSCPRMGGRSHVSIPQSGTGDQAVRRSTDPAIRHWPDLVTDGLTDRMVRPLTDSSARRSAYSGSRTVRCCSGEFTSPNGGVKPPLHQTVPLPVFVVA